MFLLIPLIAIAASVGYAIFKMKQAKQAVAEGRGGEVLNAFFRPYFRTLADDEAILYAWPAISYQGDLVEGSAPTAAERILRLVKQAAYSVVGIKLEYYTPTMYLAATSKKRLVVVKEYSSDGERGNYKDHSVWTAGTQVLAASEAFPGYNVLKDQILEHGPFSLMQPPALVTLKSADGNSLVLWLSDDRNGTFLEALHSHVAQLGAPKQSAQRLPAVEAPRRQVQAAPAQVPARQVASGQVPARQVPARQIPALPAARVVQRQVRVAERPISSNR